MGELFSINYFDGKWDKICIDMNGKSLLGIYANYILNELEKIYKWDRLYGERYGVIRTGIKLNKLKFKTEKEEKFYILYHLLVDPDWSLLNKMDTNYSVFSNVLNYILKKYSELSIEDFKFSMEKSCESINKNLQIWNLLKKYLDKEKSNLFQESDIFYENLSILAWTHYKGEWGEFEIINILEKLEFSNIDKSKVGQFKDTKYGRDIICDHFIYGQNLSFQVKNFTNCEIYGQDFSKITCSSVKNYNVDFYGFWNSEIEKVIIVPNKNIRMLKSWNSYVFPINDLIYPTKEDFLKQFGF